MPLSRSAHRAAALAAAAAAAVLVSPAAVRAFHHPAVSRGGAASAPRSLPPSSRSVSSSFGGGGLSSNSKDIFVATTKVGFRPSTALAGWFGGGGSETKKKSSTEATVRVGEHVGSGSYGTVHVVSFETDGMVEDELYIGKRPWTYDELKEKAQKVAEEKAEKDDDEDEEDEDVSEKKKGSFSSSEGKWMESDASIKERAERCKYYIDVERHCLNKLSMVDDATTAAARKECITELVGTHKDEEGKEWLVFRLVPRGTGYDEGDDSSDSELTKPALSLSDAMELDWADQHAQDPSAGELQHHHLYIVQREMGLPPDSTFADTLDAVLRGLLRTVVACHAGNVVHRDVKPQNLLCDAEHGGFVLIDFGSAADMDPKKGAGGLASALGGNGGRVGLEDSTRVAVSPIYSAPETFVRWDRAPLNFDTFSTALIFCQLLFNLLDERTDAAFHQQLEFAKYDLDTWLDREFESTMIPAGLDDAFAYLAERRGLWRLLRDMLNSDPELRPSSRKALRRFDGILASVGKGEAEAPAAKSPEEADGEFFASFLRSIDLYETKGGAEEVAKEVAKEEKKEKAGVPTPEEDFIVPRPLHYVAAFDRTYPLGLVLSEVDPDEPYDGEDDPDAEEAWTTATRSSKPGEVYVKGITEGGQADEMGIFEIGDRLRAVGEVPVFDNGFEFVVDMIGRQPSRAKTVKLHFDRRSTGRAHKYKEGAAHKGKVVGQGAWSTVGGRKAQEDAFVLHEIHDGKSNDVLMAAVFDGHGGAAASSTASQLMPSLFAAELATVTSGSSEGRATSSDLRTVLETSWDITCNAYRNGCTDSEECVADYDPREGIVLASMTSKDLVAGTTAAAAVLSVSEEGADTLTVLNCGDSRTLLVGRVRGAPKEDRLHHESVVHFSTRDHSPADELEIQRLRMGMAEGYSQPKRSLNRWRVPVGDYSYALSRSLEGPFATSKGIVSDPDVTDIDLVEMLSEREGGVIVIASDGMFEVMDNEQVGREVLKMREMGMTANDAAKYICRMANEKGTSDNVSAVIVYLD